MSRIGRKAIAVPASVNVNIDADKVITVKGPKGELQYKINPEITVVIEGNEIKVSRSSDEQRDRALHGLTRVLIANMVHGVTEGFSKTLQVIGVGYRAEKKGKALQLNVGYSHPIIFEEPDGIKIDVPDQNTVIVNGIDKEKVGEVAAKIRSFRTPNPYADSAALAKGIRYQGERIAVKEGKKSSK